MQKLSELFGKICSASEQGKKGVLVDLQTISEIRDEFWAMKQRAEAAEALNNHLELAVRKAEGVSEKLRNRAEYAENKLLFTRPAPAVSLADLVPPMKDDSIPGKNDSYIDMCDGWNACRAAILRNIEEAKSGK